MFLLYSSICIAARSPWTLILTLPLAITIRYGVVAREETYLVSGAAVRRRLSGLQSPRAPLAVAGEQKRCPCSARPTRWGAHVRSGLILVRGLSPLLSSFPAIPPPHEGNHAPFN